jgi:uncharacterized membrane protein YdbT with pleckstrin-like domain
MSYARKHLIPDEKLLYETRLHWIVLFWPVIVPTLILLGAGGWMLYHYAHADANDMKEVGVGLIVAAALVFGIGLMKRNATEMAVTNKRVLIKQGVFGRRTLEILLQKIESIAVDEPMSGRMLGYGTVTVRGTGGTPEPFPKMAHPLEFRRHVEEQVESLMK